MFHKFPQLSQSCAKLGRSSVHFLPHPAGHTPPLLQNENNVSHRQMQSSAYTGYASKCKSYEALKSSYSKPHMP